MSSSRQLAAILFTDIAGYTAMMQEDETGAVTVVRQYTSTLREFVAQYHGTIVNDYGDGNLCTFTSATGAVQCAIELQRKLQSAPRVPLRIGLHIGEVFFEDGKALGDGVNVASRIQSLGVANSILFSSEIHSKISNQPEFKTVSLGSFHFKNVSAPMEVFALANEGLTVPEMTSMEGKLRRKTSSLKKGIAAAALMLVAITGAFLSWQYLNQSNPESLRKSVAVLAFEDMSPNKDQEWFSDGISEEIINSLTNLKELKVMARTSSFYFKGKDVPFSEIAKQLGVDHLVEGSVRRVDDQLRITVQLITKDGFHLLSQTYDRPANDLLKVQNEIAEIIAYKLLEGLNPSQQLQIKADKTLSVEAYKYYLLGGNHRQDKDTEQLLLKSISLDPNYAPPYGRLADVYDTWGNNPANRAKAWRLRDSVGQIGFRLNPTSPDILYARLLTFFKSDLPNPDSTLYFLKTAFSLHPNNAFVNYFIGAFYVRIGMDAQAREFLNRSIALDPLNLVSRRWLAQHQLTIGDLVNAELGFRKMIELDSSISVDHRSLAEVYIYKGDLESASDQLTIAKQLDGNEGLVRKAMLLAAEGNKEEALKLSWNIKVLCLLKMKSETLKLLDSLAIDPVQNTARAKKESLEKNPIFDFVREEPEFKRIYGREKKEYDDNVKRYGKLD